MLNATESNIQGYAQQYDNQRNTYVAQLKQAGLGKMSGAALPQYFNNYTPSNQTKFNIPKEQIETVLQKAQDTLNDPNAQSADIINARAMINQYGSK